MTSFPLQQSPKKKYKRFKYTRRQLSEATQQVRDEVHERSGRACEKCDRARATQLAHVERRWKSESRPTANDFIDLCDPCHDWCDESGDEGREWMRDFQNKLLEELA